ncbi:MAG: CRISPR-associated endonuclease Cas1 [Pseudomonadota bacterium]
MLSSTPVKTLYLDGRAPLHVLRDGPALRVRAATSADRLFPLRRLIRVVVSGQVQWSTEALLACADAGVAVSFLNRNGTLRARLDAPYPTSLLLDLNSMLAELLESADGIDAYRNWMSAQAQHARMRLVRKARRGPWPTQPSVLRRLLFERANHCARAPELRRLDRQINSLLAGHIEHLLVHASLDLRAPCLVLREVRLVQDMANILIWPLQNPKLSFIKRLYHRARRAGKAYPRLTMEKAVRFYEANSSSVEEEFNELLRGFHLFLLERVNDHG